MITTPATSQTLSEMAISIAQKGAGFESTFRIGNPPKNAAVAGSTNSKDMGNPTTAAGSPAASASIATTAITSTGKVAASDQMATVTSLEPSLVLVWPLASLRAHWLTQDESAAASLLRVFHDGLVEQTQARDHVLENEKYASLLRRFVFTLIEVCVWSMLSPMFHCYPCLFDARF